jgi:phosphatidylethanolamine/phosphatidyl-N-methylethanolamine N-methyltransferase
VKVQTPNPLKNKGNILGDLSLIGVFTKQFLSDPRTIGSIFPSSKKLSRRMAKFVPLSRKGIVVELGAGTGVITAALLERGIPPEQLVSFELSKEMAHELKKQFPKVTIINGDACHLKDLLLKHCGTDQVKAVVSGLPLRSLPKPVVTAITHQLDEVLMESGSFIQFTYDLRGEHFAPLHRFKLTASKIIWQNIPPARVDLFKRKRVLS